MDSDIHLFNQQNPYWNKTFKGSITVRTMLLIVHMAGIMKYEYHYLDINQLLLLTKALTL